MNNTKVAHSGEPINGFVVNGKFRDEMSMTR